jgi:hypothetical protein
MATNRPDPGEFLELAQRMLRELFGDSRGDDSRGDDSRGDDPWAEATRRAREAFTRERPSESARRHREPSAQEQRENLTFALGTRAVEALEDLALNVAAIRQRLERMNAQPRGERPDSESRRPDGGDPTEQ